MPTELLEEAPIGDDYQERSAAIKVRNQEQFHYPSWHEWAIDNWGCKWDISEMEDDDFTITNDGKTVAFSFDTAWAPPTEWYDNIEGFYIKAYYYESGVGFCGTWTSEDGDDQYQVDLDDNIETVTENIPSDILDKFGIIDDMLAMQDDEELGNIDDAEDGNKEENGE